MVVIAKTLLFWRRAFAASFTYFSFPPYAWEEFMKRMFIGFGLQSRIGTKF